MSKHKIRHSKTCQNCGTFVEKNFCPKCGQENTESRHSFHHLFTHFISDFLHYDSSFLRTTKTLFLSPGKISLEYMNGKRKSYVNPFSFYIFISFLTFFIPYTLSYPDDRKAIKASTEFANIKIKNDSIVTDNKEPKKEANKEPKKKTKNIKIKGIDTNDKAPTFMHQLFENIEDKEREEKAVEFFIHNLPKALFVYMPIFAFWVWLFHNKKKRYYFDSGIFTLHFFSVVLLSITFCIILDWILSWLQWEGIKIFLWFLLFFYVTFYFFRSNRIFFGESRFKSNIKGLLLMGINTFFILVVLLGYAAFIAYKIYL